MILAKLLTVVTNHRPILIFDDKLRAACQIVIQDPGKVLIDHIQSKLKFHGFSLEDFIGGKNYMRRLLVIEYCDNDRNIPPRHHSVYICMSDHDETPHRLANLELVKDENLSGTYSVNEITTDAFFGIDPGSEKGDIATVSCVKKAISGQVIANFAIETLPVLTDEIEVVRGTGGIIQYISLNNPDNK